MRFLRRMADQILKHFQSASIDVKFLIASYIQIFIPIILIGVLSFRISSDLILKKYIGYTTDIIKTAKLRLTDKINDLNLLTQDVLYQNELYNILDKAQKGMDYYDDAASMTNKFRMTILAHREVQSICIATTTKKIVVVDNTSEKEGLDEIIPEYFQINSLYNVAAVGNGKPIWHVVSIKEDNMPPKPIVLLIRVINNRDTLKPQGLLIFMINKDLFDRTFAEVVAEKSQAIALIGENILISSKGKLNISQILKAIDSVDDKKGLVTYTRKDSIINVLPIEQVNWFITTEIPVSILFSDVNNLRRWIILLCFISFAITSTMAFFLSTDILGPINAIVDATKKIRGGKYETINLPDRKDELGLLLQNFNDMVVKINYLINSIYKEQITRRDAELKALQSQLNPHFLFNILESINWLAQLNNVPQISEVVISLSHLLEVNLKEEKFVSVEEELRYIDSYISILKMNFGDDNLRLFIETDKHALRYRIPKLLIQPIIENAVFHGIRPKGSGNIYVRCNVEEDKLKIVVQDDGIGIKPEKLKMLRESVIDEQEDGAIEDRTYTHIGLLNVVKRLRLIYADGASFFIESILNKGTTVRIEILLEAMEKVFDEEAEYLKGE